jgi:hypothetical protein
MILPDVWVLRRKMKNGKFYKWKARINVDVSKQFYVLNYCETIAPGATWISIQLILFEASRNGWKIKRCTGFSASTE